MFTINFYTYGAVLKRYNCMEFLIHRFAGIPVPFLSSDHFTFIVYFGTN